MTFTRIAWLCLALPVPAFAAPYDDCILQNMKGIMAQNAANAVVRACREKTTPKKCRAMEPRLANYFDKFDTKGAQQAGYSDAEIVAHLTTACIKECADASYWSRTFGECATD